MRRGHLVWTSLENLKLPRPFSLMNHNTQLASYRETIISHLASYRETIDFRSTSGPSVTQNGGLCVHVAAPNISIVAMAGFMRGCKLL